VAAHKQRPRAFVRPNTPLVIAVFLSFFGRAGGSIPIEDGSEDCQDREKKQKKKKKTTAAGWEKTGRAGNWLASRDACGGP